MNVLDIDYYQILEDAYKKHKKIIVCFDFDNTVYDYHKQGIDFTPIINILKQCDQLGFILLCHTSEVNNEELIFKSKWIEKELGLRLCGLKGGRINKADGRVMQTSLDIQHCYVKPYANVYLDDKAGLKESYERLKKLINRINNNEI